MTRRNTLAAAALAAILALPAAAQDAEKTLYFYNWTDYYPVELLAKFEAEPGKYVAPAAKTDGHSCCGTKAAPLPQPPTQPRLLLLPRQPAARSRLPSPLLLP